MNTKKDLLKVHLAVLLFGMSGLFAKFIHLPSAVIVLGRVFFSSIFLAFVIMITKTGFHLKKKIHYGILLSSGVILAVHWYSFIHSIQVSTVAIGTLTASSFPIFVTFLEPIFYKETLTKKAIISALIMFGGVLFMIPEFNFSNNMTAGLLWGLLSSITYAFLSLINRKFSGEYDSIQISFYEQSAAAIVLLPTLFLLKPSITFTDITFLIILGIVFTAVAHSMFISGIRTVKVQTAGIISSMESVYGILAAAIFLSERPSLREIIGGIIILSVVVYNSLQKKKA